ncbi:copper chaperone PCu(A)C [Sulfitobacter sp. S190]|uniref:copper chaperone PCu(A)C n=1 Tax=Sulfitobacter sp. S190 TaxID=2867022 RepID=UPI0021A78322|nr:copper chaperone PCu(A)C [Sulfitobacter sp. S190]UWR21630.1 copper chaperone PCu(A)C [Sulfitobacter sp. S190]
MTRSMTVAIAAFVAILAVVVTVVSIKMSPLDKPAFRLEDPYLRATLPDSPTAAAFMVLHNDTGRDDRLIGVRADFAQNAALHTHTQDENGVMRMRPIDDGIPIADGDSHAFVRGGDHLMFLGLSAPLTDGAPVSVTLVFEEAGEVAIRIPVDLGR